MADLTRDLKFNVLSDLSKLDTDKGARGLDDLGEAAEGAGRLLDRLEDTTKSVARRVGDAFDQISRGSRKTFTRDLDNDLDKAKRGLDDFKEEAHQSGREAAASFGGGFDDIGDFIQETAANAFAGFGPIGAAAGIAAAAGIGIITAAFGKSKEKAEEARAAVSDWIQAYVDGLGTIKEATIQANLDKFAEDGGKKLGELADEARRAGVNVGDYTRAVAGDVEAQKRVGAQYQAAQAKLRKLSQDRTADSAALGRQAGALQQVAGRLGSLNAQMAQGKAKADQLRESTNRPFVVKLESQIKPPNDAMRLALAQAQAYADRHPIVLKTKGPTGQRPIRDVP